MSGMVFLRGWFRFKHSAIAATRVRSNGVPQGQGHRPSDDPPMLRGSPALQRTRACNDNTDESRSALRQPAYSPRTAAL